MAMYPHNPLKSAPRRSFQIDYIDPLGGPGTLLMEGLSVGGTLKDAERRFPELTIIRVYLQAKEPERAGPENGSLQPYPGQTLPQVLP